MPYNGGKADASSPIISLIIFHHTKLHKEKGVMLESQFQAKLIKEVKKKFPGCVVLKTDPTYIQGFPDLLILFGNRWAALEVKKSSTAKHRPNQDLWVMKLNKMSFAAFIWPKNKKEVLDAMAGSFKGLS